MAAFYPGYMTERRHLRLLLRQGMALRRLAIAGDEHRLRRLIDPLAPGAASMFLLIAALYWLGFGLFALTVARRSVGAALLVPLLALAPPAFMLLGMHLAGHPVRRRLARWPP